MTIITDLGGVIINLDVLRCMSSFKKILGDNFDKLGLGADGEGTFLMENYEKGLVSSDQFVATVLGWCVPGTTVNDVKKAWNSMLCEIPEDRLRMLRDIRAKYGNLYLLSNTNEIHWADIVDRYPDLTSLFDDIFLSYRAHLSKPSSEIFSLVADSLQTLPAHLLFIDDIEANRNAAAVLGWNVAPSLDSIL